MLQHVLPKAFKSYNILRPQIFNSITNRQAVIRKKNSNYSYIRKKNQGVRATLTETSVHFSR